MSTENKYKVRLIPIAGVDKGGTAVSFDATPVVSESRSVNYNSLEPLHAPGQIQVYKNTASRTFQISDIKIISRTVPEADANLKKLWALRSWCMPRFGNSSTLKSVERDRRDIKTNNESQPGGKDLKDADGNPLNYGELGTELLGAPPPVLYLSAYSSGSVNSRSSQLTSSNTKTTRWNIAQHINRVPVVIQQLTIPYPNDVDYITTTRGVPMPLIMSIDITLLETHSPNAYEAFNLNAFKEGRLQGF